MPPSRNNQRKGLRARQQAESGTPGQIIAIVPRLCLATSNPGKIREYQELLKGIPFTITTPAQENIKGEPEETGSSFEENALLKAHYFARALGIVSLADDSGLEVDALDGEPGIRSARYAGPEATDQERIALLLEKLKTVPWEQRTARFRCVIALAWPSGAQETLSGSYEGYVTSQPMGYNGFGYDSVFYAPEEGSTFAELDPATKNRLSHRGQAGHKVAKRLCNLSKAAAL